MTPSTNFEIDCLKEQLNLAREDYNSEIEQITELDIKCQRYLVFFSILQALIIGIYQYITDIYFLKFSLMLSASLLAGSLLFTYWSLKLNDYEFAIMDKKNKAEFRSYSNYYQMYDALISLYMDATDINKEINAKKVIFLKIGYLTGLIAIVIMTLIVLLITEINLEHLL
ncbi:hypothetical protein HNP93_000898 [Methanococcus maripaludis]|uniref:Uncharacterized protein n=1 Tax=Methanococcus maripaludis TaxID=39152 RepID=A0A7J9P646_METMI|nr:hypothetical protein [Methanococcus maripaludis]MBA2858197.1 hypothetical protein [Methanococcus maripaludis]